MHKRILSLILALATVLSMIAVPASAAPTLEEAMADVNVYADKTDLNWLTMNGSVKTQWYTYYNYTSPNGTTKEVPAYCVDPELYGVPVKVPEGTPIRYGADHLESDPKLVGIISNGYPHLTLDDLGVSNKQQAYYATKMALWCYLIGSWSISSLGINPSLTGADRQVAENVLKAAKDIYQRGMYWDQMYQPKLTATPDQSSAYAVTINGEECYQQVFTIDSDTWALEPVRVSLEQGAPEGTKIMSMDNTEISQFKLSTTRTAGAGYQAQIKVVYPKSAVEGNSGSAKLKFDTVVVEYKIYYAKTLQRSEYGDIQDYLLDTDPDTPISANAISTFSTNPPPPPPPPPDPEESTLKIIKLEKDTEIPLAGAVFDVWYPDGSKYGSFATDASGTITLPINVFGNYTVTERVPPKYHILPEISTQHVTVTAEADGVLTFWNAPYGNLRIHKISNTGDNLEGVSITIKNLETGETQTGKTGPGGVIEFTQLAPGGYEVRETAGIVGYIMDVEATKTATVVTGETSEVTFINMEKPGLKIIKFDRKTLETMPDISFEFWRDGESLGIYKTNQQGEIVMNDLEPGTYLVKEVQTDNGHIADPTPQQIELKAGDGVKQLLFYNDQKPGIRLVKVDSSNLSKVIPNVKFEIKSVAGDYGPAEFTTDVNGEIDLSLLPTGAYVVTELECPDHYLIDNPTRIIQLDGNETAEFVFTDTAKPSLEVIKYDPNTGKYLAGATFRIARIEDGSHYLDRVTDTQGRIRIDDLEPGVYSVQEMSAPSGYILNDTEYHVELFPGRTSELIVNNEKKPDLKIIKTDTITGRPIAGATFTVRKVDSSTLLTETTDANGEIFLKEMDTGVYEITEQSVPDAYLLDPIPQKITLFPNKLGVVQFQDYPKPTLTIQKIDSATGKSVEGARFHIIYASNHTFTGEVNDLGEYYTDANGIIKLEKLKDGWYQATEVEAPAGYRIKDSGVYECYLEAGRDKTITVENIPLSTILIQKMDEETGKPLAGAWFRMKYLNSMTSMDGTTIGEWATDDKGQIEVQNLDEGTYVIDEISAPAGYVLNPKNTRTVYLAGEKQDFVTITYGNQKMGALLIVKKDAVTGEPLAGVEFSVTDSDGSVVGNGNGRFTTDYAGTITIANLEPGKTVIVKETRTVPGYILDDTAQTIKIKANETMTVEFRNQPKGGLVIKKLDSVTRKPIEGAEFQITNTAGEYVPDNEGKTSTNGIYRTDSNGEIRLLNLMPDSYTAVEVTAPAGYAINRTPQTTKVNAADTQTLTFLDDPLQTLVIQKYIEGTRKGLAGVTFLITDGAGTPIGGGNGQYVTDANGRITITGLTPGMTIVAREIKAAKGYALNPMPQTIIVGKASGSNVTVSGAVTTVTATSVTGSQNELEFYDEPLGRLTIQKFIEGTSTPIAGVRFLVTKSDGGAVGNTNGEYVTDANGRIELKDLEPGITVTAKELRAADGYVLDSTPKSIEIKSGDMQTLTFYNTPTGSLTIIKRDRATGAVLKDAEFQISYASGEFVGNFGGTVTSNGQYTTDDNGEIIIKGLQPSTIVIRETRAPDGYILDNSPVTVEIGANDAQTIDIFNDAKQTLTIQKYITGTTKPIEGVTFLVTDSSGSVIGPNNGEYVTDRNGRIMLTGLTPGTTITAKELKTAAGFVLDTTPQSIEIKGGEAQTMTFFNSPGGGLELIKVNAADKTKRINGVTFEIRRMDGGLVKTVTTGDNGRVHVDLDAGDYYAVEIEAAKGFKLDATPHYFTVKDGETTTLTVTNTPFSGILIHKIDADTGKGIYGASFLLYDANHNPIGEYQSDQNGYVYIDDLTEGGRYYLRELANEGYIVDTQLKTVNVKSGETIEITWKNTAIRGQIQIMKKSADDNPINGLPKGSLLEGAVFEIYDKAGNVVDTIRSDSRGRAVSKLLPLSRYTIREVSAPKYYGINPTVFNAYLEHEGQIVMFEVEDESVTTAVAIKKTGYEEVMPGQPIRYTITGVANTSTVQLGSFYWRDTLPSQVALSKVVTGTYNQQLAYKIVYKTNLSGDEYRTLADNLSTTKSYVLEARPAALGLAANERVTEVMFVFGMVKGGFAEVETAYIYGTVNSGLSNGTSIVNVADVGGLYNGQWIQGVSRWLTTVYTKTTTKLPKTGY